MNHFRPSRRYLWLACIGIILLHLGPTFSIHVSNAPGAFSIQDFIAGGDARTYIDAGRHQAASESLYNLTIWPTTFTYLYHPLFALLFSGLNQLGDQGVGTLLFLVDTLSFVMALIVWPRAFDKLGAYKLAQALRTWRPVMLTFTAFFIEAFVLNIIGLLLLGSAIATWLLASQRDWEAAVVLTLIALCKPFWLFPLAIPLLASQWRRTGKLLACVLALYVGATVFYVLVSSPTYGLHQVVDYVQILKNADHYFPWTGQGQPFKTYSLQQVLFYLFGLRDWVWILAGLVKIGVVVVALASFRTLWQRKPAPETLIWGMFVVYLTGMLILGQAHEITFAMCVFVCLRASPDPQARRWTWVYLLYAYLEVAEIIGLILGLWVDSVIPLLAGAALLLWWACLRSLRASEQPEFVDLNVEQAAVTSHAAP